MSYEGIAQVIGSSGALIIGAERVSPLFAYQTYSTKTESNGVEVTSTSSTTSMSLLANPNYEKIAFHTIPRLGFDFAVADNITLGGSVFAMFTVSSKSEQESGGVSQSNDSSKLSVFGIAARAGYALSVGDTFAFWPRVGCSYVNATAAHPPRTTGTVTSESSDSISQLALDIEPMFLILPVPHFGFTVGPVVDIPLTGKQKSETTTGGRTDSESVAASQFHLGITAGLTGWL